MDAYRNRIRIFLSFYKHFLFFMESAGVPAKGAAQRASFALYWNSIALSVCRLASQLRLAFV
ncbi:hypothetical protein [Geobacillus stearothermophilus]|uniref:hypothetical protein n=1 Tax=Geobacillus TaxID=129337 RepID=UPI0016016549|nr:hypothetical protein [Geobacillus stearothermophilus]MED3663619.1 hypothetical protein [Geobacillus stearothermophilus]MED3721174.1 hypothetical protein [Geobacillus stearothermophilus]MED3723500.1 hypothetical protein [Geobacillus stearothermophilus]MED3730676.1 hypothetical protein [Geobacillus stearothermophilus]MED3733967.1 hypothetical protein [Geobacillus stearothermophilus]